MEEQLKSDVNLNPSPTLTPSEFSIGSEVVYGLHGKCQILAIEDREIAGSTQRFYKVEVQKSALSRSKKPDPAIWIPVGSALSKGLRAPMSLESANTALSILQNKEYYFATSEQWLQVYPKLESTIRNEGGVGLAKVYSYVHVLKNRQVLPSTEIVKFFESVHRQLFKELSEALHEAPRAIEERIAKGLRGKLAADQ